MNTLALDWSAIGLSLGAVAFLFVSVLMVLVVLVQRPQGGGLSGAFGSSAGSGQTAFGAKTGDFLTYLTISIFLLFLVGASVLNLSYRPGDPRLPTLAPASDSEPLDPSEPSGGLDPAVPPEGTEIPAPGSVDQPPPVTGEVTEDPPAEGGAAEGESGGAPPSGADPPATTPPTDPPKTVDPPDGDDPETRR